MILDSFQWKTRSAAEAAFREILRSAGYAVGGTVTDPKHHRMLTEVLERHPDFEEKVGVGVAEFFIGRTQDAPGVHVGRDAIGIWIRRVDGSTIDFSYITAIRQHSAKSDAKEALRNEVDHRRLAFRDAQFAGDGELVSALTGSPINDRTDAQVIYVNPTWAQLTFRFAEQEGGWESIPVAPAKSANAAIGSRLADRGQASRWLKFHSQHAALGLATRSEAAHRRRSTEADWTPRP